MADSLVVVGGDAGYVFDLLEIVADLFALCLDAFNHDCHRTVDAALDVHRVCTCGHVLETDIDDSLSKHGCCCCSVACVITCLGSNFLDELCAHVLERIFEFNLAGHADTVFSDVGCTEFLLDDHVAAFRA